MSRINKGKIIGDEYHKDTIWNKAVLWKNREISLPIDIFIDLKQRGIKKLVFTDRQTKKIHSFYMKTVVENANLRRVGQEPQYYWSIDLENRVKEIPKEEVKEVVKPNKLFEISAVPVRDNVGRKK